MFEKYELNKKGIKEVNEFRENFANAVMEAMHLMPESREKSLFRTKVEEAVEFGTKAISRKENNFIRITFYGKEK